MWRQLPAVTFTAAPVSATPSSAERLRARRRRKLVAGLRSVARQAGSRSHPRRGDLLLRDRAIAARDELLAVAAALERGVDPPQEVMDALRWLLTDGCTSPLWNPDVPAARLAEALEHTHTRLDRAERAHASAHKRAQTDPHALMM